MKAKFKKDFKENITRSMIKTLSYRALILCSDSIIIFLITHRYDVTLGVIFFSNIASNLMYFFHERFWDRVSWGKAKK